MATRQRSSRSRRVTPAPAPSNPVPTIIGFLVFLIAAGTAIYLHTNGKKAVKAEQTNARNHRAQLAAAFQEQHAALNQAYRDTQEALNQIRKGRNRERKNLAVSLREVEKKKEALAAAELEKQDLAARKAKAEETHGRAETLTREASDALATLQQQHAKLVERYTHNYRQIEDKLHDAVRNRNASGTRAIYNSYPDSPFAPAALYHAGELSYAKRDLHRAANLYKDLLRKFPGCPYAATAQAQLRACLAGKP